MNLIQTAQLSWPRRLVLAAVAFAGSTAYALSFAVADGGKTLVPLATAIGIAAAISWICFGLVLLMVTRCRPSVLHWADVCLVAMAYGIGVKTTSMILNLVTSVPFAFHTGVLIFANIVMGTIFVFRARVLGLKIFPALLLWFFVLDGLFAAILFVLKRGGKL